jgi:hypothetical protein
MPFLRFLRDSSRFPQARLLFAIAATLTIGSRAARPQSVDLYFPSGVSGYDQQLGVTVQSRLRPQYDAPGIILDSFAIRPKLDESLLYDSDPTGIPGRGSWESRTSAAVAAGSLWTRNSLGFSLGVTNFEYLSLPSLNHTDWNVGVGGGYTIGDSQLALSYSHQSYSQLGTSIGVLQTTTPILDQTDTAQLSYAFNFSRFTVTPDISVSSYRFGMATVMGVSVNQAYLDRSGLAAGVTTRYSMSDQGGLLFVVRGIDNAYSKSQPGFPSNDSTNLLLLAGLDYQSEGVWRYRVLAGVEVTAFAAAQYPTNTSPIIQGSAIWTPTGVTTVTGTLTRQIQAPQSAGTNGFVLTSAHLVIDHELRRNILLQGRGGIQYAQYLAEGTQTNFTAGAGVTWLLNRNLRLSLDYDITQQSGNSGVSNPLNPDTFTSGNYSQSLVALTLHVAL